MYEYQFDLYSKDGSLFGRVSNRKELQSLLSCGIPSRNDQGGWNLNELHCASLEEVDIPVLEHVSGLQVKPKLKVVPDPDIEQIPDVLVGRGGFSSG